MQHQLIPDKNNLELLYSKMAVDGAKVQVYWYDVTDWYSRSIVQNYDVNSPGGVTGNARLYKTTWVNSDEISKR